MCILTSIKSNSHVAHITLISGADSIVIEQQSENERVFPLRGLCVGIIKLTIIKIIRWCKK